MRDLRANIRTFTEPIRVFIYTERIENGIPVNDIATEKKVYGNVMLNRDKNPNGENGTYATDNQVKVTIRRNNAIIITPEVTEIEIRNKRYIVTQVDDFGINYESLTFLARLKKGA